MEVGEGVGVERRQQPGDGLVQVVGVQEVAEGLRGGGEAIGDAGLLYLPATQETELGYRLIKPRWGQGLATETAAAWLQYAFDELGLPEVIAFSHPDNVASVRVMQKNGFEFLRDDNIAGMGVVVYVARKPGNATV